jgi:hypothetical protein
VAIAVVIPVLRSGERRLGLRTELHGILLLFRRLAGRLLRGFRRGALHGMHGSGVGDGVNQ